VGNRRAAQASFRYALELDPGDAEARDGLARMRGSPVGDSTDAS